MSKKTVSLQEFFRSHGSPGTYNNLPVRPRRDSDDDQGLHLRLAQSCTLDSGKAYPQRYGPSSKEGRYAEHGSYGSSDGTPVGDVDYHRPHGSGAPYHNSSGSDSHYVRRQGAPPRGPSPYDSYDKPGQYTYEPPGAARGSGGPAGMPPAGGPPGAAPMGPPMHPGSYSAGPGYGHPPRHAYSAADGYGAPPQHPYSCPYGVPPDAAARAPVGGGYAGSVPPPMGHPMPGGRAGYGAPPPLYGAPPPPPPPPRQAPPQQVQVERAQVVSNVPADTSVSAYHGRPAATAVGGVPASVAEAPAPAASAPAVPAAQPASNNAAAATAARRTTPFAAPKPEPAAAEEPPAPAAPKNEFAERLAQRAMASAARAKSSLLAGSGSGALSSADSLGRGSSGQLGLGSKPPSRGMSVDIPAPGAASSGDSGNSSPTDPVLVKPPQSSYGRPKLMLKPRSVPIQDASWRSGNYSSTSSDSGDAPADSSATGSAASSLSGGRPRLHLLPRGSSLGTDSSSGASAAGARKPSVFGDAKPREEVLKGRGLDPALVDAAADLGLNRKPADSNVARQGSAGDRIFSNSLGMGPGRGAGGREDEDEWHTVAGHGRRGAAGQRGGSVLVDDGFDPFFGSNSGMKPASRSEYVSAGPGTYNRDGYGGGRRGVYGSPSKYGLEASAEDDDDDGVVIRRALPTRQVPLAL